jgi:two-component system, NarL family, nitrate/nitrite response regulator NarL
MSVARCSYHRNMNKPLLATRLMLVDDHPMVREGLRARLQAHPGLQVVAEASGARDALPAALVARPDLVLMDVSLRDGHGLALTRELRAALPGLHVLVLSMHDTPAYVREAALAGASGYLLKDCAAEDIVAAILAVMAGQTAWPAVPTESPAHVSSSAMTPREAEVLALIAEGLSSKVIGERLGMGVRTVETHRTHLRRKLNLPSPAALVRYAIEHQRGVR